MPRRPRNEEAGAIHHVYARGVDKRPIYRYRADRELYLQMLANVVRRFGWWCLSYCQMENHVHLLIETPEPNLGRGMQVLHGDYAAAFNAHHGTTGHVFERRYGSKRITDDAHFWVAAAYVANNPVEAKLVARPDAWPWSSYPAAKNGHGPSWLALDRLYEYFGALGGVGRQRYVDFVGGVAVA
jgi:REP element-mobilizing transposase RayT